jgi:hypothetical protein
MGVRFGECVLDTVERRLLVDLSDEEALTQRAEWNEADSELLEVGKSAPTTLRRRT